MPGWAYLLVLQFLDGYYGQVTAGGYGATHNAPLERQRQHGIRHKDDEECVPDQVLAIGKPNTLANEICRWSGQ